MASLVLTGDLELQRMAADLMSEGRHGQKIFRKGLRAGAKRIAEAVKASFPRKTGAAVASVKVRSLPRKKGRIGLRIALYAASPKGFPYPMGLEVGTKAQPKAGRIRKERNAKAYAALAWHVAPQHNVEKAFEATASAAQAEVMSTCIDELEKIDGR